MLVTKKDMCYAALEQRTNRMKKMGETSVRQIKRSKNIWLTDFAQDILRFPVSLCAMHTFSEVLRSYLSCM